MSTNKIYDQVKEFHEKFGLAVQDFPSVKSQDKTTRNMRKAILVEEVREYVDGEYADNLTEIADGLADIIYVAFGTAITYGIPINEILDEVHRSNMSKLGEDGNSIKREDGKILKGPNYFKPDIAKFLK